MAVAVCALALAAAGCGGTSEANDGVIRGARLTIYSSLPFEGPDRAVALDVAHAQRLALREAGARAGRYTVRIVSLDAATSHAGRWDPGQISQNARRAARDPRTIAYLGELHTGSSAISIPLLNEAGILEVSPLDSAIGLTTRSAALPGSPERYYPNAQKVGRTFARVVPSDRVQALAQLRAMGEQGVRRLALLIDDDPSGQALALALRADGPASGIVVSAPQEIDSQAKDQRGLVSAVLASHPDAVLDAGGDADGATRVWSAFARADPSLKLYASAALADGEFLARAAATGAATYVTRPVLAPSASPPAARRFARAFARRYRAAPAPEALYGYEAMRALLAAIARASHDAGSAPITRADVVRAFFATRRRGTVLGDYAIERSGDTTLRRFGVFELADGGLRLSRVLNG